MRFYIFILASLCCLAALTTNNIADIKFAVIVVSALFLYQTFKLIEISKGKKNG